MNCLGSKELLHLLQVFAKAERWMLLCLCSWALPKGNGTDIISWRFLRDAPRLTESEYPRQGIYFCFIDYAKDFDCVDHSKLENSERREYQTT